MKLVAASLPFLVVSLLMSGGAIGQDSSTIEEQIQVYGGLLPQLDSLVATLSAEQLERTRRHADTLLAEHGAYAESLQTAEDAYVRRLRQIEPAVPVEAPVETSEVPSAPAEAIEPTPEPATEIVNDPWASSPAVESLHLGSGSGKLEAPARDALVFDGVQRFAKAIAEGADRYDLRPAFVLCVMKIESNYDGDAVSQAGAIGFMQLMPGTADDLNVNPYDIYENVLGGTRLIDSLLKQFSEDVTLAMAAYNAGPGRVRQYDGVPPFPETQNYVRRIADECGPARP